MLKQDIHVNGLDYLCEYYEAHIDYNPTNYKEYMIIRDISVLNNISYDNDIYFIEKPIFEKIKNSNSDITNLCCFPAYNSNFGTFSNSYKKFSSMININNFDSDDNGGFVYRLLNKNLNQAEIPCDKIKIYHPYSKSDLDYIIYLDNYINGIHFHYYCNLNSNLEIKSETEIIKNNNKYSEYVEIYFPNLNYMFNSSSNVFFIDNMNITKFINSTENSTNWVSMDNQNKEFLLEYIPLDLIINPFIIRNNGKYQEKIYYKLTNNLYNNYASFPINITLYPYSVISNNFYLSDDNYEKQSNTFINENKINISSKIGFINNKLSVITKFNYKYNDIPVQEAYALYNGLTIYKENDDYKCEEYTNYVESKSMLKKSLEEKNKDNKYFEADLEEYLNESEIKCCGYRISIYSDYEYNDIVYTDYKELDFIDDFAFTLDNIFNDWNYIPDILLLKVMFIDKFLGITMPSNTIILTKEYLKYMINNDNKCNFRIFNDFIQKQNNIKKMSWGNCSYNAENINFNFIDKINCIIENNDNTIQNNYSQNVNTKIIYKPIFYRVVELSSITLKNGLQQNVGINLSSYMTKVESFKLLINNIEYNEIGRNDIYVIFKVDSSQLNDTQGKYNILDNNDVFISSGSWKIE